MKSKHTHTHHSLPIIRYAIALSTHEDTHAQQTSIPSVLSSSEDINSQIHLDASTLASPSVRDLYFTLPSCWWITAWTHRNTFNPVIMSLSLCLSHSLDSPAKFFCVVFSRCWQESPLGSLIQAQRPREGIKRPVSFSQRRLWVVRPRGWCQCVKHINHSCTDTYTHNILFYKHTKWGWWTLAIALMPYWVF